MSEESFIGTDIISVPKIAAVLKRYPERFPHHTFTEKEITYCSSRPMPEIHYAGRFAAKEAVKKALLSSGVVSNISLKQIEVIRLENGAPKVIIHSSDIDNTDIKVSISHTAKYATATALICFKNS